MPKMRSKVCSCQTHHLVPKLLTSLLFVIFASMLMLSTAKDQGINPANRRQTSTAYTSYGPLQRTRVCNPYQRCRRESVGDIDVISYGENLSSEGGGTFQLGFFVRQNQTYLGIWYSGTNHPEPEVIVWVANRDNPIPPQRQQNCSLVLGKDGNATLHSDNQSYWSTNSLTTSTDKQSAVRLLENGNLQILQESTTVLWQSFDHPTDTFIPGMHIDSVILTSWESPDNPAQGYYDFRQRSSDKSLTITSNKTSIVYCDNSYSSVNSDLTSLFSNKDTGNSSLRLVMNASGSIQLWKAQRGKEWVISWWAPKDQCDLYNNSCGNYGVCNAGNSFMCKCLPGFKPMDPEKWESRDFSSGCSKKTMTCGRQFLKLHMIKVASSPDIRPADSEAQCKDECQSARCSCKAYSYNSVQSNCSIWMSDPNYIVENNDSNQTLNVRVDSSDIELGPRTCSNCGINEIPYPLSTRRDCGDPTYFSFQCNVSDGQVYFRAQSGIAYMVSHISPEQRKFFIQLAANNTTDPCNATDIESNALNLNSSNPFNVTNCSLVHLMNRPNVVEVEMSWKPPPLPACKLPADCKDWPHTTCGLDANGKKVCICGKGFSWNPLHLNCTQELLNSSSQVVHHKHMSLWLKAGIATASGTVLLFLSIILFILHLRRTWARKRAANIVNQFRTDDIEDIDIPFVDYESILVATNNFSDSNKLGVGGFGPVYKGQLADGNEIAIKRLSAASAQGIEEFRNEVVIIAKLQHRNLVRVLGYCVKADEKILIYEYMPNKSLDSFLFDQTVSQLLDWKKRFNIILGVARGLLYLHQDSRLRIIHRDLKPSNILLDEELNPKISDFGLARIFGGNETATSTARVVGTYGYMSPEYALDGYFSIKSDVYSFGIVVLEVVSGKRCTSLLRFDENLISLLGYAWNLWVNEKAIELADKAIVDSLDTYEVKRCINVGLLCVQEDPSDRPTMSTALLMLGGDNMDLPYPKQPVFVARRKPPTETTSSSGKFGASSDAELTTTVEGR